MRLSHVEVRGAGLVAHAWGSSVGLVALRLGRVPRQAGVPGGRPLAGVEVGEADASMRELSRALRAYFEGEQLRWDGPLDLRGITEFQCQVFAAVREIPHGHVRTYAEVARAIGRPQAVRAVGNALHRNPFSIVVPCHRVVREGGRIGGFALGPALKRRLLSLEMGQKELGLWEEA